MILWGEVAVLKWHNQNLDNYLNWLSQPLDVWLTDASATVIYFLLMAAVWYLWGRYLVFIFAAAGFLTVLPRLGDLAERPRPTAEYAWSEVVFGNGGYPSGHMVYAVLVAGSIAFFARKYKGYAHRAIFWAAWIFICLIPISRLIERNHWPADLLGGAAMSSAALMILIWIEPRLKIFLVAHYPRLAKFLNLGSGKS